METIRDQLLLFIKPVHTTPKPFHKIENKKPALYLI